MSGLGWSVAQIPVNNMQVLLLSLFVRTTSSHPIVREVFYDFDDDYGTDFESHDYVWTPPPVTTVRPIPARPCGVICQFEQQDHYTSSLTGATTEAPSGGDVPVNVIVNYCFR